MKDAGQQAAQQAAAEAERKLQAALAAAHGEVTSLHARLDGEAAALTEARQLREINSRLQL